MLLFTGDVIEMRIPSLCDDKTQADIRKELLVDFDDDAGGVVVAAGFVCGGGEMLAGLFGGLGGEEERVHLGVGECLAVAVGGEQEAVAELDLDDGDGGHDHVRGADGLGQDAVPLAHFVG